MVHVRVINNCSLPLRSHPVCVRNGLAKARMSRFARTNRSLVLKYIETRPPGSVRRASHNGAHGKAIRPLDRQCYGSPASMPLTERLVHLNFQLRSLQ